MNEMKFVTSILIIKVAKKSRFINTALLILPFPYSGTSVCLYSYSGLITVVFLNCWCHSFALPFMTHKFYSIWTTIWTPYLPEILSWRFRNLLIRDDFPTFGIPIINMFEAGLSALWYLSDPLINLIAVGSTYEIPKVIYWPYVPKSRSHRITSINNYISWSRHTVFASGSILKLFPFID